MAVGQRVRARRARRVALPAIRQPDPATEIFPWSRAAIWALALGVAVTQWALWQWVS
ncbi:MAG: hypothetical protein M3540_07605 [Actinomycetota bacterium]|nr:hypothetical protein [Actinomycetota bacterium]